MSSAERVGLDYLTVIAMSRIEVVSVLSHTGMTVLISNFCKKN